MNLTDIKTNGPHFTHQTIIVGLKTKNNYCLTSTTKKSNNCLPKLPSVKELKILNLKEQLYRLTLPGRIPNYEAMNSYLKTIIALNQKIEQLESDLNTPATVGEYYEQLNKK